jgi:hypothetical protein
LFIHGHRRFHGDGAGATPPGLYTLCRRCATQQGDVDAEGLSIDLGAEQSVVLAASVPLTKESGWRALEEGEIVVVQRGRIQAGLINLGPAPPQTRLTARSPGS